MTDWLHSASVLPPVMWSIFALTYIGIALGGLPYLVLDRTGVALLGAIAMVVFAIDIPEAASHIDYETILLLFGLMIFSAQLRVAGFYAAAGRHLTPLTDRPGRLLAGIIIMSAALSALLANDIVCLAFTPLLCAAILAAGRNPIPYLVALAMSSNIGSAATIIGNPQNMYIGTVARLPFAHFTLVMLPVVVVSLALTWLGVMTVFKRELSATGAALREPRVQMREGDTLGPSSLPLQTTASDPDRYLITKTMVLLAALVACFVLLDGQWRAISALAGAAILLCSRRAKAARLYQLVDWNLIILFMGLFIVNGAMNQHGLTAAAFGRFAHSGVDLQQPWVLSSTTLALSNLVSNVPAVMLLKPTIAMNDHRGWYLLALVSTFAGNLTLVGSIANLIVAESASAFGVRLSLRTYCKLGIPLTLVTAALGTVWLLVIM